MPYTTNPTTGAHTPTMPLPQHLAHKPVYAIPYEDFDGIYAASTDARYLSIGIAQYNDEEVSMKVLRHTGAQWSPQAEELPIHRPIDMALFLAKVIFGAPGARVDVPAGTFLDQSNDIEITPEHRSLDQLREYEDFLRRHRDLYRERFKALLQVLKHLEAEGEI